jgi:hypothetical protein
LIGGIFVWIGWYGFNVGSAFTFDNIAMLAFTNPAAGVMTTKPANAPSNNPSKLVVFLKIYSRINQPIA